MSLKKSLGSRPLIYEIVPPKRDTSRFNTELQGIETVLHDSRIDAINIPELVTRRKAGGQVQYSPTTIPPEEYALMVREYKDPIVNIISPRLPKDELLARTRRILRDFGIRNVVIVGKEKHEDILPGPSVLDAIGLVRAEYAEGVVLGGICIFDREAAGANHRGARLTEAERVWSKARAGCEFVTSQLVFDPAPALDFLTSYSQLCQDRGTNPLTVFVSLASIPTPSILSLVEGLDVLIPPKVKRRMVSSGTMGVESLKVAVEVLGTILSGSEERRLRVPLGVQVEQIGVNSAEQSLELLDHVHAAL